MKNTALTLLTSLALAASAQAGEDYSAKGKEVIPPAAPCLWTWFAGGSIGQVTGDWDEEIYTLHVGVEYKCPGKCSHALYLEVGYTEDSESYYEEVVTSVFDRYEFSVEIIPITLNYKYECALTGNLNWYVGAGAGVALVEVKAETNGVTTGKADDTTFYAHAFAGLVYNIGAFEVFGGARYIWMNDLNFGGGAAGDSPLDGEIHYEIGGRFNF